MQHYLRAKSPDFFEDKALEPDMRNRLSDFRNSGYDRGHLVRTFWAIQCGSDAAEMAFTMCHSIPCFTFVRYHISMRSCCGPHYTTPSGCKTPRFRYCSSLCLLRSCTALWPNQGSQPHQHGITASAVTFVQAAAANHKGSQEAMDETFTLCNISPQVGHGFNRCEATWGTTFRSPF